MKKISIITISYNHSSYIAETIESVLNQTVQDFDYIIWDDGSGDNSREIIEKYAEQDPRIQFYTHKDNANKGLPETMRACVEKVATVYTAFLEGDDLWDPSFLANMFDLAEKNNDYGLFYSNINVFGDQSYEAEILRHEKMVLKRENFMKKSCFDRSFFLFNLPISCFSSVFLRSFLLKECCFDTPIPRALDRYVYMQCFRKTNIVFVDKKMCSWRKHSGSFTGASFTGHIANNTVNPAAKKVLTISIFDMLFTLLYPESQSSDLDFCRKILSGRKEKIFRSILRPLVCFYLKHKYGEQLFSFKKV